MITIYKLFDPTTGQYTDIMNKEDLAKIMAERAYNFFLKHTHNSPYTMLTIDAEGRTTWRGPLGDEFIPQTDVIEAMIPLTTDHVEKAINATKDAHGKNDLKVFK